MKPLTTCLFIGILFFQCRTTRQQENDKTALNKRLDQFLKSKGIYCPDSVTVEGNMIIRLSDTTKTEDPRNDLDSVYRNLARFICINLFPDYNKRLFYDEPYILFGVSGPSYNLNFAYPLSSLDLNKNHPDDTFSCNVWKRTYLFTCTSHIAGIRMEMYDNSPVFHFSLPYDQLWNEAKLAGQYDEIAVRAYKFIFGKQKFNESFLMSHSIIIHLFWADYKERYTNVNYKLFDLQRGVISPSFDHDPMTDWR